MKKLILIVMALIAISLASCQREEETPIADPDTPVFVLNYERHLVSTISAITIGEPTPGDYIITIRFTDCTQRIYHFTDKAVRDANFTGIVDSWFEWKEQIKED